MNRSIKWVCGLCTYENYPAALKCVMCCQPCPTPLIQEPTSISEVITNRLINQSELIYDRSEDNTACRSGGNYADIISNELQSKAKITEESENIGSPLSGEQLQIDEAGAASGGSCEKDHSAEVASARNNELNKKWVCHCCTYANWNRSLKCVICHTSKSTQSGRIIEQPSHEIPKSNDSARQSFGAAENPGESHPHSPQPGAYGHLYRSYSSNASLRYHDNTAAPMRIHKDKDRCKKSLSEENLNNIMNTQDSACSQHLDNIARRFCDDNTWLQNEAVGKSSSPSYCDKFPKSRDMEHGRSWKKSNKRLNWLFLKACMGILEDSIEAVDRYLMYGGNIARPLTADEVKFLNRPSAFDVGYTLVHLAVRFRRHNILALILTPEVTKRNLKRSPAILCPEIADHIRHEIFSSIRMRNGSFHCQYFCDYLTFLLPIEIAGLPSSIQRLLFDELLDKDVQKELEDEFAINWCADADRLYALWNRSAGDCLLDSVLQATWGVFDRDNVLRRAMAETMQECSPYFYTRWKEWELMQASLLNYSLSERQCLQDWAFILSLARQPGASLEHCHIFVLSHILRRPIIVYGVKYLKSFQGDTLGFAKFQGVYLPFLWDSTFCWKSPIALGYTRGHFTALVPMENDSRDAFGSGPHESSSESLSSCTYLPLMDCARKLLPIHFTSPDQGQLDDQQECILYDWMDCLVTNSGVLVAKQKRGKRPPLVTRLLDQWLDHYRHLSFRRLGEDGETEDEE